MRKRGKSPGNIFREHTLRHGRATLKDMCFLLLDGPIGPGHDEIGWLPGLLPLLRICAATRHCHVSCLTLRKRRGRLQSRGRLSASSSPASPREASLTQSVAAPQNPGSVQAHLLLQP
jgi:hypothetical protein